MKVHRPKYKATKMSFVMKAQKFLAPDEAAMEEILLTFAVQCARCRETAMIQAIIPLSSVHSLSDNINYNSCGYLSL